MADQRKLSARQIPSKYTSTAAVAQYNGDDDSSTDLPMGMVLSKHTHGGSQAQSDSFSFEYSSGNNGSGAKGAGLLGDTNTTVQKEVKITEIPPWLTGLLIGITVVIGVQLVLSSVTLYGVFND